MTASPISEDTMDERTPTNADFNPDDIVRYGGKEWRVQGIDDEDPIGLLLLDVAEPKVSPNFVDTNFPVTRGSGRRPDTVLEDSHYYRWCWACAESVELVSRPSPTWRTHREQADD